jgi:hypothetical protein
MKRLAIIVVVVIVASPFLYWFWQYWHTAKIIISSNSPKNNISIIQLKNGDDLTGPPLKESKGRLEVTLREGRYLVSVESRSAVVNQVIVARARTTLKYTINTTNATGVEPVASRAAQGIMADDSQLVYLDTESETLYQINSQNSIVPFGSGQTFRSIQWADKDYGIGQDNTGRLYVIDKGSIRPLGVPFEYEDGAIINYSVSNNRQVFISKNSVVYSSQTGKDFKKIYSSKDGGFRLTSGGGAVVLTKVPKEEGEESPRGIVVVNNNGGAITKDNINLYTAAWSNDGKYLAFSSDPHGVIYDNRLRNVATIPGSNISRLMWADEHTVFYSIKDQLWVYNLPTQKSTLLANMPLGDEIFEITLSRERTYIYLSVLGSSGGSSIKRIGLKGQQVPDMVYKLQSVLPVSIGSCLLDLINFKSPTVLIKSLSGPSRNCQAAATDELRRDGFDLSKLQLQYSP